MTSNPKDAALPTTLDEVRTLATVPVHSTSAPSAAGLLGLSRGQAYRSARDGSLPSLRVGGRVLVPVPQLRRALGDLTD